jgi:hypothetical protein
MIFSDLPSPAEASNERTRSWLGFAQAGNRFPLFGIMLYSAGAAVGAAASASITGRAKYKNTRNSAPMKHGSAAA